MNSKILSLVLIIVFLLTQSGCATYKSQMRTDGAYSANTVSDRQAQWQKEEREWLLAVLIVLGFAIVLGATISASSGGGGLSIGANN